MGSLFQWLGSFAWKAGSLGVILAALYHGTGAVTDAAGGLFDIFRVVAAESSMDGFHKVLYSYYIEQDKYPPTGEQLYQVLADNYDKEPEVIGVDPWDKPYWFLNSGWEVMSAGPDGQYSSRDDIIQKYPGNVRPPAGNGWVVQS